MPGVLRMRPVDAAETEYGIGAECPVDALAAQDYSREVIRRALLLRGESRDKLFELARARRAECFPAGEVEVRSVIELSKVCQQSCNYCSMAKESKLKRYVIKNE